MEIKTQHLTKYHLLLDDLKTFCEKTNLKLTSDIPEIYFIDNANFFTKSLMVLICAYLESYIKEVSMNIVNHYNSIFDSTPIPENIIKWGIQSNRDFKEKDYVFREFRLKINRKDIDEHISGSPYRTITLFKKLGIELNRNNDFESLKDKVNTLVIKRNKILHYNDNASDVSLSDINQNIDFIKEYISILDKEIAG